MGCNCGKGRASNVAYQVKFPGGSAQTYDTLAQAQAAIAQAGIKHGATIKAVPK
jgi:hypothetical protein